MIKILCCVPLYSTVIQLNSPCTLLVIVGLDLLCVTIHLIFGTLDKMLGPKTDNPKKRQKDFMTEISAKTGSTSFNTTLKCSIIQFQFKLIYCFSINANP